MTAPGKPAPTAPTQPVEQGPGLDHLSCTADIARGTFACGTPSDVNPAVRASVYGGQGTNVVLSGSNIVVAGATTSFDATIQNLIPGQAIGTRDGVNADAAGVRVFFDGEPTNGVTVANADGQDVFLNGEVPFFQYGMVPAGGTSAPKTWRFNVPSGVTGFTFKVYVETEVQARLVISEIMANPASVQDSLGEFVEVYNIGRFPVNLNGFSVRDNGGSNTVGQDVFVAPGQFAVLGRVTDNAKNGGLSAVYGYAQSNSTTTNLQFSNSGADRFVIKAPSGVTIDSIAYSNSGTVAKAGVSREVLDLTADNTLVDGSNWADATVNYTAQDKGTPGAGRDGSGGPTQPSEPGPVVTVSVSPSSASLNPGATRQLTATGRDASSQTSPTTFTWTSTDTAVATVSASGLVTARAVGSASIRATSANGVVGTASISVTAVNTGGASYLNHLEFGLPMDADSSNDIIIRHPQFVLSYSNTRGGPNWVSWDLNATHFGPAERCDCFAPDPLLPSGAKVVVTGDYTGSGYSRGHMVMSEQRTSTDAENEVTFYTTNILPQIQDMNGGPWLKFENYTNDLARTSNKEVYNISGGIYSANPATLNGAGKVQIPTSTWKIIVIMPRGQGLADVTSASSIQVIAVNMPNQSGIQNNGWEMYRVSVDAIEAATGYDFLASLPDNIEAAVEAAAN